jgi:hypothetical protein
MAIFLKIGQKSLYDKLSLKAMAEEHQARGQKFDPQDLRELMKGMFEFCGQIIEEEHVNMSLTETSMSLRALHQMDLITNALATKIFKLQVPLFANSNTLEIYSIVDLILEVNVDTFYLVNKAYNYQERGYSK